MSPKSFQISIFIVLLQGVKGVRGLDGHSGLPGDYGVEGPRGSQGVRGEPGYIGAIGPKVRKMEMRHGNDEFIFSQSRVALCSSCRNFQNFIFETKLKKQKLGLVNMNNQGKKESVTSLNINMDCHNGSLFHNHFNVSFLRLFFLPTLEMK